MRVRRWQTSVRNESDDWIFSHNEGNAPSTDLGGSPPGFEWEHVCRDPKDGELCLNRLKSAERQMEDRSDIDVQIVRRIWV